MSRVVPVNQQVIKKGVKLIQRINNQSAQRTSLLISQNTIRTEALARVGVPLRIQKGSLEDRTSTQGDEMNTSRSSRAQNRNTG